jgi:carbon monoxide dehydrogenase subunit G
MFKIKAEYGEKIEVKTSLEKVREFFADTRNFVELMPNVEGIKTDANGVAKWTIRAEIPLLGAMTETFNVEMTENNQERIEYSPARTETKNYLRYAADFMEKSATETLIQIKQTVELRREKARDLHFLAGLAGEKVISGQMQQRVAEMIKTFLKKARTKLEG